MIEINAHIDGDILAIKASGKLSKEELTFFSINQAKEAWDWLRTEH